MTVTGPRDARVVAADTVLIDAQVALARAADLEDAARERNSPPELLPVDFDEAPLTATRLRVPWWRLRANRRDRDGIFRIVRHPSMVLHPKSSRLSAGSARDRRRR